jgi:hypothetical protein
MVQKEHGSSTGEDRDKVTPPLSPFLFILAIDFLQYILQRATEEGLLSPLQDLTARLQLSLCVDDTTVFINSVKEEVDTLMEIMR